LRHHVMPIAQLPPGQMRCVTVAGRRILLARTEDGIYAVDELCSHEDASLCDGFLRDHQVACPLHGSRFDLRTGEPQEEPAETPLECYGVALEGGVIWVEIT